MAEIKLTKVPFTGTAEQERALRKELESIKTLDGSLMPALQAAQDIYGYLPMEVQKIVAEELSLPLEKVFGAVTFYSQFTLNPRGKYVASVCLGTACYVKGAGDIFDACKKKLGIDDGECTPDRKFSLISTRCIGCCGLAPVMTVNEQVFGKLVPSDIPGIFDKYIKA